MRVKFVGFCPRCNSPRTGYFVGFITQEKLVRHFKNGERIRGYEMTDNRSLNCFCEKCKFRWHKKLKKEYLTNEEFNEYLHDFEFYKERDELKRLKTKKPTLTKEEKAKRFKKTTSILAYTTGIDIRKFNPYEKKGESP